MLYNFSLFSGLRRFILTFKRLLALGAVAVSLTACGGNNLADLEQYIEDVKIKAENISKTLPPPAISLEIKEETVSYDITGRKRDPFVSWVRAPRRVLRQTGGPRPEKNRSHEILEDYPMDSLRLTGTFKSSGEEVALVKAPNGVIHRIKIGNHMGINYGKVTKITKTSIKLRELVPNGLGGYTRRTATLSMNK